MGLRTFTFAGTSSSTYSMFITEAATYNVPERAVEMLEVPGRNGYYALDQGRFENVEVTYHVVVHKDTNANFQTELSSVRNWLASKVGYQRLTDDYNSNVYRMAIFKGGLETDEAFVNGAEFDIVFECKPQRWLTSGETATAVANNGTLSNPTLFDSSPLLAVKGYGKIAFNGYEVEITNRELGTYVLVDNKTYTLKDLYMSYATLTTILSEMAENGDDVTVSSDGFEFNIERRLNYDTVTITNLTDSTPSVFTSTVTKAQMQNGTQFYVRTVFDPIIFSYGTSQTYSNTVSFHLSDTVYSEDVTIWQTISYNSSTGEVRVYNYGAATGSVPGFWISNSGIKKVSVIIDSTATALGNPTYIDCDTGEAYRIMSDEYITLNHLIALGSNLPILTPGTNTFTYNNTITEFKVTPRWWKI